MITRGMPQRRKNVDKILTLCEKCREAMEVGYRVKKLTTATTERKKACENCGMKGGPYVLSQYLIQKKKGAGS